MEYPTLVQIETTSRCNAKCFFCPHKTMKRPKEDMPQVLFDKIVKDCQEIKLKSICPFLNGEPFADSLIFERLEQINKELPDTFIDIFSNMSLLDEGKIDRLSLINNINNFVMSVTSYNEKSCKDYMGLSWKAVFKNIQDLIGLNNKRQFIKHLQIASANINEEEKKKLRNQWQGINGIERFFITTIQNWKGDIVNRVDINSDIICPRAWHICILSNGKVALCCMDQEGDYSIGDIKKNTILEIFNNEKYKRYRTLKKKDLVPCKNCSMQ